MNCEYIPQCCLNQQFKYKKEKSHFQLEWWLILFSNPPAICEEAEQVVFDSGSILYLILWEKTLGSRYTGLNYISYVISNVLSTSVVFDYYSNNVTATDNTHKRSFICYLKTKMMHF